LHENGFRLASNRRRGVGAVIMIMKGLEQRRQSADWEIADLCCAVGQTARLKPGLMRKLLQTHEIRPAFILWLLLLIGEAPFIHFRNPRDLVGR
jgi:hypothetical protein